MRTLNTSVEGYRAMKRPGWVCLRPTTGQTIFVWFEVQFEDDEGWTGYREDSSLGIRTLRKADYELVEDNRSWPRNLECAS